MINFHLFNHMNVRITEKTKMTMMNIKMRASNKIYKNGDRNFKKREIMHHSIIIKDKQEVGTRSLILKLIIVKTCKSLLIKEKGIIIPTSIIISVIIKIKGIKIGNKSVEKIN